MRFPIFSLFLLVLLGCSKTHHPTLGTDLPLTLGDKVSDSLYQVILANDYTNLYKANKAALLLKEQAPDSLGRTIGNFYFWKTNFLLRGSQKDVDSLSQVYWQLHDPSLERLKLLTDFLIIEYNQAKTHYVEAAERFSFTTSYITKDEYKVERNAIIAGLSAKSTLTVMSQKLQDLEVIINQMDPKYWNIYQSRTHLRYIKALESAQQFQKSKEVFNFVIKKNQEFNLQTELIEAWFYQSQLLDLTHKQKGLNTGAIHYLEKCIEKSMETGYKLHLHVFYNVMGHHYSNNENFEKAYTYYEKAVENTFENNKDQDYVNSLTNMAWAYFNINPKKNYQKANDILDKAIALYEKGAMPTYIKQMALERKLWSLPEDALEKREKLEAEIKFLIDRDQAVINSTAKKDYETQYQLYMTDLNNNLDHMVMAHELTNKKIKQTNLLVLFISLVLVFVIVMTMKYRKHNKLQQRIKLRNEAINLKNQQLENILDRMKVNHRNLGVANLELVRNLDETEKMISRMEKFALILSREFKFPLSNIKNLCTSLNGTLAQKLTEKEFTFLSYVDSSSDRLNQMVAHLYDYSIDTKELMRNFKPVDLNKVMTNVHNDLYILIRQTNTVLNIGPLETIEGDESLIHQLFLNLISNAIKYRKEDQKPVIDISMEKLENKCTVHIMDNGRGIKEGNANLFDIYTRSSNTTNVEGKGIGLSTCKEITDLHGGSIWYNSELNVGTTFHVSLTVYRSENQKRLTAVEER